MNVTPEQFDRAFAEFQEFGPRRRIDVEKRWREILPEVSPSEFPGLKSECQKIEGFAVSLAERVRDHEMEDLVAIKDLAQTYPILTKDRLGRTWSQAMYFSMK